MKIVSRNSQGKEGDLISPYFAKNCVVKSSLQPDDVSEWPRRTIPTWILAKCVRSKCGTSASGWSIGGQICTI
jgi:hypothetical protein